ncbi:MAG: FecCD family ABC transporter permease [Candidatus Methanofastidiosia archaeon]
MREITEYYQHIKLKRLMIVVGLILILFFTVVLGIMVGSVSISPATILNIFYSKLPVVGSSVAQTWPDSYYAIVLDVRLPRVVLGMLVGTGLAVSGCGMQGLFRNPMASPYVCGISSGGAFGAALAVNLGLAYFFVPFVAFIFSTITVFVVYFISRVNGKVPLETLLLSGIAVASFFSALVSLMLYMSGEKLERIVFWMMGGLWAASWEKVVITLPFIIIGVPLFLFLARDLNALLLGEENASDLGVEVESIKQFILVLTALMVGACVAMSGVIGFVGLIIPHITRIIVGPDHKILIPSSALVGGIFLILTDIIARTVIAPAELPVGIITSLFGVPFFLYLLRGRKAGMGW